MFLITHTSEHKHKNLPVIFGIKHAELRGIGFRRFHNTQLYPQIVRGFVMLVQFPGVSFLMQLSAERYRKSLPAADKKARKKNHIEYFLPRATFSSFRLSYV
jgi:hypothetical protein